MHTRQFRETLQEWNRTENTRQMPWKGEKDPYRVWLSEIILQQTRVEQGRAYYERFITAFPTVKDLSDAPDERIFKLWEGLGYYSRCKNLILSARHIALERGGRFPDEYEDILELKGVGPYTAAAIASFAFGLPHAVVDGNVLRVLSRFFGIGLPVDSTEGRAMLTGLAEKCLDREAPGLYNQAIMDFGAVVCKPANPDCGHCPFRSGCIALKEDKVGILPLKSKRLTRKDRHFIFVLAEFRGSVYIRKRTGKDIWENLFEFIGYEVAGQKKGMREWEDYRHLLKSQWFGKFIGKHPFTVISASPVYQQSLTHQQIHARFVRIRLEHPLSDPADYSLTRKEEMMQLAFPRLLNDYLNARTYEGSLF